jgi:hypothetical protein
MNWKGKMSQPMYISVERAPIGSPPTPRSFEVEHDGSETVVGKTCREIKGKINTNKNKKSKL